MDLVRFTVRIMYIGANDPLVYENIKVEDLSALLYSLSSELISSVVIVREEATRPKIFGH